MEVGLGPGRLFFIAKRLLRMSPEASSIFPSVLKLAKATKLMN